MAGKGGGIASLISELGAGRIAKVYFLDGEDAFLKVEAMTAIQNAVLGEKSDGTDWNLTLLEGGSTTLPEVLDAAMTLPMGAQRRLVIVRNLEKMEEPDPDYLKEYLKKPSATTCLVFQSGMGGSDRRTSFIQALVRGAVTILCEAPRGAELTRWIRERVRKRGGEIDEEAVALLELSLGAELLRERKELAPVLLSRIDREVEKILDYVAPARNISKEALEETLGTGAAGSIFALAEAAAVGDTGTAIPLLRRLLAEGEDEVRLLGIVGRQARILILGKALMKAGRRGPALAGALGIPPFFARKTEELISRFPERAGFPVMRRILEADRAIKVGAGKASSVLERLILDLGRIVSGGNRGKSPGKGARA